MDGRGRCAFQHVGGIAKRLVVISGLEVTTRVTSTDLCPNPVAVLAAAIAKVQAECVVGKDVAELCLLGDSIINQELANVYKGKKIEKGIAFPTCVSLNNCCGHFSPLKEDSIQLKEGDVAKMWVPLSCLSTPPQRSSEQ